MSEFGSFIIHPGPGMLLAMWTSVSSLAVAIVVWVAFKFRTGGTKLARSQAQIDYPDEQIVGVKITERGFRPIAEVSFASGKSVRYQIAAKEEIAVKVTW